MSVFGIGGMPKISNSYSPIASKTGAPNWDKIPHKGMDRPAGSEFDVIIDDLAKALAEAAYNKDDNKYNNIYAMAEKARCQYVSAVSPDRKALVEDATQFINNAGSKSPHTKKTEDKPQTLFDYLNIRDGIVKPSSEGRISVTLDSGTTIVFNGSDLQPDIFDVKSSSFGQPVISHGSGQWHYSLTPQERVLHDNFLNRINSAEKRYYHQYVDFGIPADGKGQYTDSVTPAYGKVDLRA